MPDAATWHIPLTISNGRKRAAQLEMSGPLERAALRGGEDQPAKERAALGVAPSAVQVPRTSDKQADDLVAYDAAYAAGLAAERAKVEAERARTEGERMQTAKAIAAFSSLADRLDAMAAERAKPWWRRLAG